MIGHTLCIPCIDLNGHLGIPSVSAASLTETSLLRLTLLSCLNLSGFVLLLIVVIYGNTECSFVWLSLLNKNKM